MPGGRTSGGSASAPVHERIGFSDCWPGPSPGPNGGPNGGPSPGPNGGPNPGPNPGGRGPDPGGARRPIRLQRSDLRIVSDPLFGPDRAAEDPAEWRVQDQRHERCSHNRCPHIKDRRPDRPRKMFAAENFE